MLDGIDDSEIHIANYTLIRSDRKGTDNHGGVACYIFNNVSHNLIEGINTDMESCWIDLMLKHTKPITIGVVYLPNKKTEHLCNLKNVLEQLQYKQHELIVVGDFNLNILDNVEGSKIDDLCCEFQLNQLVDCPTRVTATSSTCIDLVLSSHSEAINVTDVIPLGLSDHSMIWLNRRPMHMFKFLPGSQI